MYDVFKPLGSRSFTLTSVLFWTIHEFLGYGIVVGVTTKVMLHVQYATLCGTREINLHIDLKMVA